MEIPSWMKRVTAAALLCIILVTLSVLYVDRPVARYVFHHRNHVLFYEGLASPSLISLPGACLFLVIYTLRGVSGRTAGVYSKLFLTLSIAIVVAAAAKDELKWIIGRPWPVAWMRLRAYHILPFTDDYYYGSFPSGHTADIAAPMFVLWWWIPRYRPLYLGLIFVVMAGLVLSGYHWVGDVIAGLFLGLAAAAGAVAMGPEVPRLANLRSRRSL